MRRRDDDALADLDAVLGIAPRGICEHHARAIIIRKNQRTLDRAGRQHHLARANLPQPLARQVGIGDEVGFGHALVEGDEILRVIAERLGARHQAHVGRRAQRGDRCRASRGARSPSISASSSASSEPPSAGFSSQTTTRAPLSLAASAAARPAGPAPTISTSQWSNVRIAVGIGLARARPRPAARRIAARRRASRPSSCRTGRAHEGLVIEAGAEQRRQQVVDRADVEGERRPAILARGDQSVIELDLGRAQVRRDSPGPARDG